MMILTHLLLPTITILARDDRTAAVVARLEELEVNQ